MISVLRDSILARLLVAGRGPAVQHGHVTEYQNAGYNVHFCVAVKGPSITLCPYLSVLRQCPQVQGSDRSALPRWLVPAAAMAAVGRYSRCQVNFPPDACYDGDRKQETVSSSANSSKRTGARSNIMTADPCAFGDRDLMCRQIRRLVQRQRHKTELIANSERLFASFVNSDS
jgi:hypothetical protein